MRSQRWVDNLNAAAALAKLLVGANQFAEFLQTLVETGILRWRGEVADGGGVTTPLGDGGLGGVIGVAQGSAELVFTESG